MMASGDNQDDNFCCKICGMKEKYEYYGKRPPFKKGIVFTEDVYILRDPFSPRDNSLFLLLGSKCSVCDHQVCQAQECSIFYTKRFCLLCAKDNLTEFPKELHKDTPEVPEHALYFSKMGKHTYPLDDEH